jgi:starch synthase
MTALVPLFIKKYNYNNPLFLQSKVVYSVYKDDFKKSLNPKLKNKVLLDNMQAEDVELLKDPTYLNVSMMAIDYSDAVIKGEQTINSDLEKYIKSSGKLFLDYQPKDTYIETYNDFYEKIW